MYRQSTTNERTREEIDFHHDIEREKTDFHQKNLNKK